MIVPVQRGANLGWGRAGGGLRRKRERSAGLSKCRPLTVGDGLDRGERERAQPGDQHRESDGQGA